MDFIRVATFESVQNSLTWEKILFFPDVWQPCLLDVFVFFSYISNLNGHVGGTYFEVLYPFWVVDS